MEIGKSRVIVKNNEARNYYCYNADTKCAGSSCMAWRWVMRVPDGEENIKLSGPHCPSNKTEISAFGYCGMVK